MPDGPKIGIPEHFPTVKSSNRKVHSVHKDEDNTCSPSVPTTDKTFNRENFFGKNKWRLNKAKGFSRIHSCASAGH